ncbi:complement C1q tumor necrosis factor-related protein 3-like [Amphiura filiformis]|uniref:complement C1q tumor necrosis factor-related protein 3-like n=1 Tax=Amphiura filiformis TaxID=82378 RepID=UPI003B2172C9
MDIKTGVEFLLLLLAVLRFQRGGCQRIGCNTCCRGPTGKVGAKGDPGDIGPRGERGENGSIHIHNISAFSAVLGASLTHNAGEALPFISIHTNVGDDFDGPSGIFTCTIPGIYRFTYSIYAYDETLEVFLMKNQDNINGVYVYIHGTDYFIARSNSAVLQLASGDKVWLKSTTPNGQFHNSDRTTFSGVIIHEM